MLRKLILASLLLLATAVAIVLVAPSLIDWTRYRPEFAHRLSELFDRPVKIGGALDFELLPQPVMTLGDVSLGDGDDSPLAKIRTAKLRLSWLPLLTGRVELERLVLDQPEISLNVAADGKRNWQTATMPDPGNATENPSPWIDWLGRTSFKLVSIQNGRLHYRDQREDRTEELTGINIDFLAGGPGRSHDLNGEMLWRGRPLKLLARASPSDAGQWQIYLNLGLIGSPSTLTLPGHYNPKTGMLTGVLRVQGARPAELLRLLLGESVNLPKPLADTLNMQGRLELDESHVLLDQLKLKLGSGTTAQALAGQIRAEFAPHLRLSISGKIDRLPLADWLPAVSEGPQTIVALLPALFQRLPGGLELDLAIGQAGLAGGSLNNLIVKLKGDAKAGTLGQLAFDGPDGLRLSISGDWSVAKGLAIAFQLAGNRLESALQLAGLPLADGVTEQARAAFAIKGRAVRLGASTSVTLDQLSIAGQSVSGGLRYVASKRPAWRFSARSKALNLDAIWPPLSPLPFDFTGLAKDPGFDLDLDIAFDSLTARGLNAKTVVANGRVVDGALTLDKLTASAADGLDFSWQGTAKSLYPPSGLALTGKVSLTGLPGWVARLNLPPAAWQTRIGAVAATVAIKGDGATPDVTLDVTGGEGRIQYAGLLPIDPKTKLTGTFRFSHPELIRLLAMMNDLPPPARAIKPLGAVDIFAKLAGPRGNLALSEITAKLAGGQFKGKGSLSDGARPVLALDLQGDILAVDPLLSPLVAPPAPARWSSVPFDLDWLRQIDGRLGLTLGKLTLDGWTIESPALNLTLVDGALTLVQGDGQLAGGKLGLHGSLTVPAESDKPYAGTLALRLVGAKPDSILPPAGVMKLSGGALALDLDLTGSGRSPAALVKSLGGSGRLQLSDCTLSGIDLPALTALYAADTPPSADRLRKPFTNGTTPGLSLDAALVFDQSIANVKSAHWQSRAGAADSKGAINLDQGLIDLSTSVTPAGATAPLGLRLKGPTDRPDRLLDLKPAEPAKDGNG